MFFIQFQFKVAFRAPSRRAFPPPVPCFAPVAWVKPFLVLAQNRCLPWILMVLQQTGKTFCVCAAKVDHKIVAIAFTYNNTPPPYPSPSPSSCWLTTAATNQKSANKLPHKLWQAHRKLFLHSGAGQRCSRWEGGGGVTHTPRCLPQFQALPLADVQLTNVKLFLLLANVIDWPLTVDWWLLRGLEKLVQCAQWTNCKFANWIRRSMHFYDIKKEEKTTIGWMEFLAFN